VNRLDAHRRDVNRNPATRAHQEPLFQIVLNGAGANTRDCAAKVMIKRRAGKDGNVQLLESDATAFQSSVRSALAFWNGVHGTIDSLTVSWPIAPPCVDPRSGRSHDHPVAQDATGGGVGAARDSGAPPCFLRCDRSASLSTSAPGQPLLRLPREPLIPHLLSRPKDPALAIGRRGRRRFPTT